MKISTTGEAKTGQHVTELQHERGEMEMVDKGAGYIDSVKMFRDIRKLARKIDPNTAEVDWFYVKGSDPYVVSGHPTKQVASKQFFARSPGTDTWVWLGDLPREVGQKIFIRRYFVDKLAEIMKWDEGKPCGFNEEIDYDLMHELVDDLLNTFTEISYIPAWYEGMSVPLRAS